MNNIKIIKEPLSKFPSVQEFYSSVKYYSKIQSDNIVFSCYESNKIVGVVRLAPENSTFVLRGMMIAPSHQRKGIGTLMIKELEKSIGQNDCYCIPHNWLESFYGQIGFKIIEETLAPDHLQERIIENRKDFPHLVMMKRKPLDLKNCISNTHKDG